MKLLKILLIGIFVLCGSFAFANEKSYHNADKNALVPDSASKINEVDSEQRNYNGRKFFKVFHKLPEKPVPFAKTDNIELYFIDGFFYKKPAEYARTSAVQALISEINSASDTIDFAVFGFSSQPELIQALLEAQKRGVKVRWVVDMTPWNFNFYGGTKYTMKLLPDYVTDYETDRDALKYLSEKGYNNYNGTLMHDKYFIIDKNLVWTGSTNISSSGTGGYNTNVSVVIRSNEVADLYTQDFEKMFVQKKFHKTKPVLFKKNILLDDKSELAVFFSPNIKILNEGVLPIINNSKNYIYIPIFYLTSQPIIDALLLAHMRGVDVKIIADAHYATAQHSRVDEMRQSGLRIKIENWGGKMHMKSLIADDQYTIIGSCNFTSTGVKNNDENMIILKNSHLAVKFREKFNYYWELIPEKWLYANPSPEGKDSIGSCADGLDNDHDSLIDKNDPDCKI